MGTTFRDANVTFGEPPGAGEGFDYWLKHLLRVETERVRPTIMMKLRCFLPLLALLCLLAGLGALLATGDTAYAGDAEQADLEVSSGLKYSQMTGLVDNSKAVSHFTAALGHDLPDKTYIQVLMWRGSCQEQLKKPNEALADYLRGLLACSYYELPGGWPEIQSPKVPISVNSSDPGNDQRLRDCNQYRKRIDFQQFLLMQRYYFIEAVKRVRPEAARTDGEIVKILGSLSPDSSRCGAIMNWLKSENKRPWP
jgi:hypothetical protein